MEIVFDIHVASGRATVTTKKNKVAESGLQFTIKSNDPTTVIVFEDGSPAELKPGKQQKLSTPLTIDVLDSAGRKKVRHAECGHVVGGVFDPWGGGGFDTPPIGGGDVR